MLQDHFRCNQVDNCTWNPPLAPQPALFQALQPKVMKPPSLLATFSTFHLPSTALSRSQSRHTPKPGTWQPDTRISRAESKECAPLPACKREFLEGEVLEAIRSEPLNMATQESPHCMLGAQAAHELTTKGSTSHVTSQSQHLNSKP